MIFQAGNVYESANLFNLKKKKMTRQTVGFEPTTQMVQYATYANHKTTENLLDGGEII